MFFEYYSFKKDRLEFNVSNFTRWSHMVVNNVIQWLLATQGKHNTEGSRLYRPYICQEDDYGAVLVADKFNDRMLVLTAEGHWRRVRLSDKLQIPEGAVWWKGRLYVSTWRDNKLSMFQWIAYGNPYHMMLQFCELLQRARNQMFF